MSGFGNWRSSRDGQQQSIVACFPPEFFFVLLVRHTNEVECNHNLDNEKNTAPREAVAGNH
jgi:hypothetical protein